MVNTHILYALVLLWASSFSSASDSVIPEDIHIQTNYDFIEKDTIALSCTNTQQKELLNNYEKILFCKENDLCIKTNKKDICYKTEADEIQSYSFLGQIPSKNIVIIRYEGEEEFFDDFISLESGKQVLRLPKISVGFLQTLISPKKEYMLSLTTNDGYAGNPYLTNIDIYELVEDPSTGKWPNKFSFNFKEKEEGPHKYNILWLDDNTVKVQSLKDKQENIVIQKINSEWSIKDKSYKSWEDYNPDDNE